MKIGIDARFIGPAGTGLGKYTEKLIQNLVNIDKKNQYAIFLRKNNWDYLKLGNKNFSKILADVSWYSLEEQLKMPKIYSRQNLDLLHVPHFNVPLVYTGNFVVTIHDLIHHQFSQEATTTKNLTLFKIKRLVYKFTIGAAVKRALKIIVPSNYVKDQIVKVFKVNPSRIIVTYEAAEEEYFKNRLPSTVHRLPTLLYVGNAYPHKNLNRLLAASKILYTKYQIPNTNLLLICPRDIFWQRLDGEIKARNLEGKVRLMGYIRVGELTKLFVKASAYVFPSLSEGFGIPGLNAMAAELPVACSDIPTFKEVYGEAAIYFNPHDPKDIAFKIKKVLTDLSTRSDLIEKGRIQAKKYSWQKMAAQTLAVYQTVV